MSADYEPGTVAKATVLGVEGVRVARYDAGWVRLDDPDIFYSDKDCDDMVTDVCPLVVLDLDALPIRPKSSTLSVLRQWQRIAERDGQRVDANVLGAIADQIKAQTKPPRIPEPGLWGVVEASSSLTGARRWVRHPGPSTCWRDAFGNSAVWDSLIDPVLIREGVES